MCTKLLAQNIMIRNTVDNRAQTCLGECVMGPESSLLRNLRPTSILVLVLHRLFT